MKFYGTQEYETMIKRNKKRKLKRWVKNILYCLLGVFIGIIYSLFIVKNEIITPVGVAYCRGNIIQICSGSDEVLHYYE